MPSAFLNKSTIRSGPDEGAEPNTSLLSVVAAGVVGAGVIAWGASELPSAENSLMRDCMFRAVRRLEV